MVIERYHGWLGINCVYLKRKETWVLEISLSLIKLC